MKKEPLFIAFSIQKVGVGKSTFTVPVASYLHYQSKAIALFESLGKQTYPTVCAKPEEAILKAREFLAGEPA